MAVTEIAAQQLLVLTQALAHEGFDSAPLEKQAAVATQADIRARPWRPLAELEAVMQSCREISGDDGFGLVTGTSFSQLRMGTIAQVVANAPTLRTALDDLGLFYLLVQDQKDMSYGVDGGVCTLYFDTFCQTPDARRFRAEHAMGGMMTLLRLCGLVDEELLVVHFQHERPPYAHRYADIFGDRCVFGQGVSKICFQAALLDREKAENTGTVYEAARATAMAELSASGERSPIAFTVRSVIQDLGFSRGDMDSVAAAIGFNVRTLRRQLARHGVSFQQIFDDLRLRESKKLIVQNKMPLKQIAERTGYESVAHFHRAFKRMTGLTPAQWRQANSDPGAAPERRG